MVFGLQLFGIGPYATVAVVLGALGFVAVVIVARMMFRTLRQQGREAERN